jgi:fructose-1-phosphate kinase PfkB-like protein
MPAPEVLTLTCNLLAEHCFVFPSAPALARAQRATSSSFQVGGKGLNVSKMLARLGTRTLALAAAGGDTGSACRAWAATRPWPIELLPTASPTRLGLVARGSSPQSAPETTFLGPDLPLCPAAFAALAGRVDAAAPHTLVALCGSVPGWDSSDAAPLRAALARRARNGLLVVDTYGPPLAELAASPAALIKINADEFAALAGVPCTPETLRAHAAASAAQAWIVSDGPRGVLLAEPGHDTLVLYPPPVREVSATGSGDVLLAALLHARLRATLPWGQALAWSLPLASANAAHPGVAEFDIPARELPSPPRT